MADLSVLLAMMLSTGWDGGSACAAGGGEANSIHRVKTAA